LPVVPPLETRNYPGHPELCAYMQKVAEAVPHLVKLFSIGESPEGRPLMLAEVTNQGTGAASLKPALWVDGNIRGDEVAGSVAALALLQRLAADHGRDELVTFLLDTRTFYILPRVDPDGAEFSLKWGAIRTPSKQARRVVPGDVDGDGRILQMRQKDPQGGWKASRRDPRLLLRRAPDDRQGPFYRLDFEGFLGVDGTCPERNLARNFPGREASGALLEPEARAVAHFLRSHPNVGLGLSLRSSQGRILTPSGAGFSPSDRTSIRQLGLRAEEITGCPLMEDVQDGDLADWMAFELGIPCLRSSLWSLPRMAGLERECTELSETEYLAILRWLDRERAGAGFVPWRSYQHPQLGTVEIGGWDLLTTWLNPPPGEILALDCQRSVDLALSLAGALPRLVADCREEKVGWADADESGQEGLHPPVPLRKIVLEIANEGYLPTWISEHARVGVDRFVVELTPPAGGRLLVGSTRTQVEPLAGFATSHLFSEIQAPWSVSSSEGQSKSLEWLVRGDGEVRVQVHHPRAGSLEYRTSGEEAPGLPPPPIYTLPPPPKVGGTPPSPVITPVPPLSQTLSETATRDESPVVPPPPSPVAGYRPTARLPQIAGEARPAPSGALHRAVSPSDAATPEPPASELTELPMASIREDSPLRKEVPGRVLGETTTGRVLGAPPTKPGPVHRSLEEELPAATMPESPGALSPSRPLPPVRLPGGDAEPPAPPVDEGWGALPSSSRIPAPLLLRRSRQPEGKNP
jgi:hypothetical protein